MNCEEFDFSIKTSFVILFHNRNYDLASLQFLVFIKYGGGGIIYYQRLPESRHPCCKVYLQYSIQYTVCYT